MTPQQEPTLDMAGSHALEKTRMCAGGHWYDLDSLEGSMALAICLELQKHSGHVAEYDYSKTVIPDTGTRYDVRFRGHLAAVQGVVARHVKEELCEDVEGIMDAVSLLMRKVMHSSNPFLPELTIHEECELLQWLDRHRAAGPLKNVQLNVTIQGENHEDTV